MAIALTDCHKSGTSADGGIPVSEADREILDRIRNRDLVDEFQAAPDAQLVADPLLGGHPAYID